MREVIVLVVLAMVAFAVYQAYRAYQAETKEARTVKSLPPSVQHVVAQMDGASQAAFFNEYEQKKKKRSVGWILWFVFGIHYLYVGKGWNQLFYWITGGGLGLWAIADLFRMPSIIRSANDQIARQALQTLHIGASFGGGANIPVQPGDAIGFAQPAPPYPSPGHRLPNWPTTHPILGHNPSRPR